MEKIFGYDWEEIQARQQGTYKPKTMSGPIQYRAVTDHDRALLAKHGSIDAVEAAGFFGSAEALRRAEA